MPSDPTRQPPSHIPTGRRFLRCDRCGRTHQVYYPDLMRYTREGWPTCCGHTMAYFAEVERPRMSDPTPPEGPALPPGP